MKPTFYVIIVDLADGAYVEVFCDGESYHKSDIHTRDKAEGLAEEWRRLYCGGVVPV